MYANSFNLRFDALLNGPRKKIDFSKVKDKGPVIDLYMFEQRTTEADSDTAINKIFGEVTLRFCFIGDSTETQRIQGRVDGLHRDIYVNDGTDYAGSQIFLNCQSLMPLMRADLSNSQRIAQQFNVANCVSSLLLEGGPG
jgi:hypothetical protein